MAVPGRTSCTVVRRSTHPRALAVLSLVALVASAVLAAAPAAAAAGTAHRRLFVFGDSTVDVGNNNYIKTVLRANFAPYGIDFRPKSGRFSNGKLLIDFLAKYMGIRIPPPYLQPRKNTYFGANFASGGAGALNSTYIQYGTIPLLKQVDNFMAWKKAKKITTADLSESLFFVSIGANDYFEYFANPGNKPTIEAFVRSVVTNIAAALQTLTIAGARKIVAALLPPMGCIPAARFNVLGRAAGLKTCVLPLNNLATGHNVALTGALAAAFPPRPNAPVRVTRLDLFNALNDIINQEKKFGFGRTLAACCGAGRPSNGALQCGTTATINGITVRSRLCRNRNRRIFWDYYHPSQHVGRVLAGMAWNGAPRYISPITIKALVEK